MLRKAWGFGLIIALIMSATVIARPKEQVDPAVRALMTPAKAITGDVIAFPDAAAPQTANFVPYQDIPGRDSAAFGEEMIVGYTYYDYQANGSIGKQIAKDASGAVHFTWMKGYTTDWNAGERHMCFNYIDSTGVLLNEPAVGVAVDESDRTGYGALTVFPNSLETVVFYHAVHPPLHPADYTGTAQSVDFMAGFGSFAGTYPNTWPGRQMIWPKGDISRSYFSHIIATENGDFNNRNQNWQALAYWRGETNPNNHQAWTWTDPPVNLDTASTISAVVSASHTSNKVALAWFHSRVGVDWGPWASTWYYQRNNDIHYIVSENGRDFDFAHNVRSLTKTLPTRPELADVNLNEAYGDTFRPFCDIDIQFDPWGDDDLYAVFPASGFWEEPYANADDDGDTPPVDNT